MTVCHVLSVIMKRTPLFKSNQNESFMKKLLFQFDTDAHPSAFDVVVAYDGGADHVISYAGLTPDNVAALVDGTIFTRAPKDKKKYRYFCRWK